MKTKKALMGVFVLAAAFFTIATAQAAGFALYEFSARGNALGGTLVARADDASAVLFNPAGLTQLPGVQLQVGASLITPMTDVDTTSIYGGNGKTERGKSNTWTPPHLYASWQLGERYWLGMGVFSRFGLGTEFDENWDGRYNSYNAAIQTLSFNPNLAVKLTDSLSLAFGVEAMYFDIKLNQKIDAKGVLRRLSPAFANARVNDPTNYTYDVDQMLTGSSTGFGFNIALHYKPLDWLSLGASYRSQVEQSMKGNAELTKSPAVARLLPTLYNDSGVSGKVVLPDMLFFGIAVKPLDNLSIELGGVYTWWSKYKDLTIKYESNTVGINPVTKTKNWKDVWRIGLGVEYKPLDWLALRASYVYDQDPINDYADYLVPSNDRQLYSLGVGFKYTNWTLDLSYTYLSIAQRDVDQRQATDGVLTSTFKNGYANIIGVTLGYAF